MSARFNGPLTEPCQDQVASLFLNQHPDVFWRPSAAALIEENDMIKREHNPVMQFIVGAGSPVTWTVVILTAIWFWS